MTRRSEVSPKKHECRSIGWRSLSVSIPISAGPLLPKYQSIFVEISVVRWPATKLSHGNSMSNFKTVMTLKSTKFPVWDVASLHRLSRSMIFPSRIPRRSISLKFSHGSTIPVHYQKTDRPIHLEIGNAILTVIRKTISAQ